ncbi:MAG: excinuclease ABC subunit UvrC [Gammaproteobacteria bacterium]|nr:excinuclease ABC subunit UvrC [Gammaproteobacteria bacterium]
MPIDPKPFIAGLARTPGVYVMRDQERRVLYVGKARSLRSRVGSYFKVPHESSRIQIMMADVDEIEIHRTRTETEALLLESNLIKTLRPKFNILLRDDKSYPYLKLSLTEEYPRLSLYRGRSNIKDRLFGPYASAGSVRVMLAQLQKIVPVRQCDNNTFKNRSRPCLQYQIKRCSAPCVNVISKSEYDEDVKRLIQILDGRESEISEHFASEMDKSSERLDFEAAAVFRDRVLALRRLQERQYISDGQHNVDVVTLLDKAGMLLFSVMKIRGGHNLGSRHFSEKNPLGLALGEVMQKLLVQHYQSQSIPGEIILTPAVSDLDLLQAGLTELAGRQVKLKTRVRGNRSQWLEMGLLNANDFLRRQVAADADHIERMDDLAKLLNREEPIERIECFDTSHSSGEQPVASCVVFDRSGAVSSEYRRFNIRGVTPGDDFGAMEQVVGRRMARVAEGEGVRPDVLLIDGGKGQVKKASEALAEHLASDIVVLGIAKGQGRKSGRESLFLPGQSNPLFLDPQSPAHLLLRQIRDEAHRFAITGHRKKRAASRNRSQIEDIPGIGAKKRQALLRHFGGIKMLRQASPQELVKVEGISVNLAQRLVEHFRTA